ncbi:M20/M25/M40 family metallo-hydrolase [Candidatus Woesearchaeota archaeon]|nr:M20/M25/M40 family metallo-hydrolase [Candidatus Woesearchaeota archaeon]MBW3016176.1 M20/M25/M40 family metallo-hydrolase [Candidatus Woesearchaeota archaeon]
MDVVKLLKEMVGIRSFSNQEKKICDFVYNLLKSRGFNVKKQPVDKNGYNIIAKVGRPKFFFLAHLDTVEPFIKPRETKDMVYGRGACDNKGSAACILSAAFETECSDFGMIFTVGEEYDFRGAKKLKKLPFVVVGEPTNLKFISGHYGVLVIKVIAKGKKYHSSMPEKGKNAIVALMDALNPIRKLNVLSNIAKITGGIADNIVPDYAEATVSFRIHPKDKKDYYKIIKAMLKGKAVVEKVMEIKGVYPQKKFSGEIVRYCTELSVVRKGVVVGPGKGKYAHTDGECISKKDLMKGVKFYLKLIEKLTK